jgi:hypothetical protein
MKDSMLNKDRELELQVLLEEYRTLNGELLLYVQEMIRCFVYLAILVGAYLGVGLGVGNKQNGVISTIQQYLPYGLPVLALYFLVLSYIRIGLSTRRGILERKINELMGTELMGLDSFTQRVQSRGFVSIGEAWYAKLPTPMPFLCILIFIGAVLIFGTGNVTYKSGVFFYSVLACGLLAVYVFFVYPWLAKRANNSKSSQSDQ